MRMSFVLACRCLASSREKQRITTWGMTEHSGRAHTVQGIVSKAVLTREHLPHCKSTSHQNMSVCGRAWKRVPLPHPREDGPPPPPGGRSPSDGPPTPPLGNRTTTVYAHLQAQKLQHKTKQFSIRYVQRAANVRRPTP